MATYNLMFLSYQSLDAITKGIEKFQMNVAIAKTYELVNGLTKYKIKEKNDEVALSHVLKILIRVIEPMVPHLAEECWTFTQSGHSIISEPWPAVDQSFLEKNDVIVVIQINGKRRAEINIEKNTSEDEIYKKIKEIKNIKDALEKNNILKSIYVPNKILNIVLDS